MISAVVRAMDTAQDLWKAPQRKKALVIFLMKNHGVVRFARAWGLGNNVSLAGEVLTLGAAFSNATYGFEISVCG